MERGLLLGSVLEMQDLIQVLASLSSCLIPLELPLVLLLLKL